MIASFFISSSINDKKLDLSLRSTFLSVLLFPSSSTVWNLNNNYKS